MPHANDYILLLHSLTLPNNQNGHIDLNQSQSINYSKERKKKKKGKLSSF